MTDEERAERLAAVRARRGQAPIGDPTNSAPTIDAPRPTAFPPPKMVPAPTRRTRRTHAAIGARILASGLTASAVFGLTTAIAAANQPASVAPSLDTTIPPTSAPPTTVVPAAPPARTVVLTLPPLSPPVTVSTPPAAAPAPAASSQGAPRAAKPAPAPAAAPAPAQPPAPAPAPAPAPVPVAAPAPMPTPAPPPPATSKPSGP